MQEYPVEPKKSSKGWLVGLGIGCGAIIVIIVFLLIGGFFFVRNIANTFKQGEDIAEVLRDKYGKVEDYCPDPEGGIGAERIEAFLSVREAMLPAREKIEKSLSYLEDARRERRKEDVRPSRRGFSIFRSAIGLVPQIGEFLTARNRALLDAGMGLGEYRFLYTVVYFSWLGKSPGDGPSFQIEESGGEQKAKGGWKWDWKDRGTDSREERRESMMRRLHRQLLPMLRNQIIKLGEGGLSKNNMEWKKSLEAEVSAMESDSYRLPWQNGLPRVLEDSLQPFRGRLEESYSPLSSIFEIIQ